MAESVPELEQATVPATHTRTAPFVLSKSCCWGLLCQSSFPFICSLSRHWWLTAVKSTAASRFAASPDSLAIFFVDIHRKTVRQSCLVDRMRSTGDSTPISHCNSLWVKLLAVRTERENGSKRRGAVSHQFCVGAGARDWGPVWVWVVQNWLTDLFARLVLDSSSRPVIS